MTQTDGTTGADSRTHSTQADPIKRLVESIFKKFQDGFAGAEPIEQLEQHAREIFAKFELVPRRDYEAHVATLETLEAQVATLEARLLALQTAQTD